MSMKNYIFNTDADLQLATLLKRTKQCFSASAQD